MYFLKFQEIESEKKIVSDKSSELEDEISAIKIDLNHNSQLLDEENKKLSPLRDKKMENLAKIQKINLELDNLILEENRIKSLQEKLRKSLNEIDSDLEREKSITLDATLNEKRVLEEKKELLKTENELTVIEDKSSLNLDDAKKELNELKAELDVMINELEVLIDSNQKINKETFKVFKNLINKITVSQENTLRVLGKMSSLRVTRLKEKRESKI